MKTLYLFLLVISAGLLGWQKTVTTKIDNFRSNIFKGKIITKGTETLLQDRIVVVPGNRSTWALIANIPANSSFQIQGSGTVDFGCKLGACKDGVNAGVTGDAFAKLFRDNWGTIEKLIEQMVMGPEMNGTPFNEKIIIKPGADISTYIVKRRINHNQNTLNPDIFFKNYTKRIGSKVNYDQGGFWIVMTTDGNPPVYGQNTFCDPALYFWYNQLYKELIKENFSPVMKFTQPVWVWVLPHDGGRNPFNINTGDFHDNTGAYKVWIQ